MQCERARELLSLQAERASPDAELSVHLAGCDVCRAARTAEDALDRRLALDTVEAPGPGFDTRFFARLEAERTKGRSRRVRWLAFAFIPAAVALAAGLLMLRPRDREGLQPARVPPEAIADVPEAFANEEELELMRDLELIEELEIVSRLEELEDFELLEKVDPSELEKIAGEAP